MKTKTWTLLALLMILWAPPSDATLIKYDFSGTFSRSVTVSTDAVADAKVGDFFAGSFTYEDSTPLFSVITPDTRARYSSGTISATTNYKSYFASNGPQLQIFDNWEFSPGGTAIDDFFLSVRQYDLTGPGFYLLQLNMRDYATVTLDSLMIPSQLQVEQLASNGRFFLRRFSSNGSEEWWADGSFSGITTNPVPEPSTIALFVLGISFLYIIKRKTT